MLFSLHCYTVKAQKNKFDVSIGYDVSFKGSISSVSSPTIYSYNKKNYGGNVYFSTPTFNIGVNYQRILSPKFSFFTGCHIARTQTELIFKNFNNPVDFNSYVKYGYEVQTLEFPFGVCHTIIISNRVVLKNYLSLTMNLNSLSGAITSYRLRTQNSPNDTTRLRWTDIEGFPSGSSFGVRYGIGVVPFKKYYRWEIGAYINYQFNHSFTWNQEVEFENITQKTYEHHHAILKDKPDYVSIHIKYNFWRF